MATTDARGLPATTQTEPDMEHQTTPGPKPTRYVCRAGVASTAGAHDAAHDAAHTAYTAYTAYQMSQQEVENPPRAGSNRKKKPAAAFCGCGCARGRVDPTARPRRPKTCAPTPRRPVFVTATGLGVGALGLRREVLAASLLNPKLGAKKTQLGSQETQSITR